MADKRTTRWRGPYHKLLTSVDAPRVAVGAEVELGRDVCVHPVPFTRYRCAGSRLGSGKWLAWTRGRGRAGMLGLSLAIPGHSITRLPLALVALAPA